MAKSQLEIAAERFNAQLKAVDDAAVRKMLQLYEPARKRLLVKITQLIEEIEKTGVTTAGNVYKLDRWTELVNQIDREIARLSPTAAQIVQDGQGTATTMAKDHSVKLAQAAVPSVARAEIAASWNKVPTKAIDQLVGRLQDGSPIREWIDEVAPKMIAKFEEEIVAGMTQGQHPSVISARLGGIVDVEQSRLDQMVRDQVLNSYRSASLNTYAENADILDGWQWLSARDDTVCGSCLGLDDGRIFSLSETFFEAHSRCRCSPSPVVSGFPPIQRETGEEWLLKQSDEKQDALLGKAAGQAFRDGDVKLEDFISKRTDDKWGDSFVQGSFRQAEKNAAARGVDTSSDNGSDGPSRIDIENYVDEGWNQRLADRANEWENSLDENTNDALFQYKTFSYQTFNDYLRDGKLAKGWTAEGVETYIGRIDEGLKTAILDRDIRVWRGIKFPRSNVPDLWDGMQPGSIFTDPGYVSTTTNRDMAELFGGKEERGNFLLTIFAPEGSSAAWMDRFAGGGVRAENELLLPRNTTFLVRDRINDLMSGQVELILEVMK